MKKIYLLTMTLCMGAFAFAQSGSVVSKGSMTTGAKVYQNTPSVMAAEGDTLFFFDSQNFYILDAQDQNDFAYENVDVDGLTPYNSGSGVESDWNFYYSLTPSDFLPGDGDSAFYFCATSWFNPAGQADNWFTVGPITIPAGGAKVEFKNKSNPGWTDGFKVFVSTTGTTPYQDFEPTTDSPVSENPDCNPNPPACTPPDSDTLWQDFNGSLNPWAGERVYLGFWHNTSDGDVCCLDHILVTETNNVGLKDISAAGNALFQNQPNPAGAVTTINFELAKFNEKVELEVVDVMGRKVKDINLGEIGAGSHKIELSTFDMASGTYYYTLVTDADRMTRKMVITK